jgi:hypothetical protein
MTMPRTKQKPGPKDQQQAPQGSEENVSGYFRLRFKENPKLLTAGSNQELLQRWLDDHPGEKEVPQRVKNILSNLKSVLRKKRRKKKGKGTQTDQPGATAPAVEATPPRAAIRGLETLEEQIDDCMTLAKNLDRDALASVVQLLRKARNAVVWQQGQ